MPKDTFNFFLTGLKIPLIFQYSTPPPFPFGRRVLTALYNRNGKDSHRHQVRKVTESNGENFCNSVSYVKTYQIEHGLVSLLHLEQAHACFSIPFSQLLQLV